MLSTTTIPQLHLEHQLWINELNFYKEEIILFNKYLVTISKSNYSKEATVGIEHFQNQFIIQRDVIDHLKHELGVTESRLVGFVKELSGLGLDSIRMDNHSTLRKRMKTFREIYSGVKNEFRRFEAEWL